MLIAEPLLAKTIVILAALLLSVAAGLVVPAALRRFALPLLAEKLAVGFARRLNRDGRSAGALAWRGGALTVLFGLTGFGLGAAVERAAGLAPEAWIVLPVALAAGLAIIRPLHDGRRVLAVMERRADPLGVEERRILPAQTIEHLAAGLNAGLIAPLFWYLLLGLPGLGLVIAWNALDRALDRPERANARFAQAPRQMAVLVNLIPLWLSGVVLLAASLLVPRCSPAAALRALFQAMARPGWIVANPAIAIVAGALGTQLANRRAPASPGWNFAVGAGSAPPLAPHLRMALMLYGVALVQALLMFLLAVHFAVRVS